MLSHRAAELRDRNSQRAGKHGLLLRPEGAGQSRRTRSDRQRQDQTQLQHIQILRMRHSMVIRALIIWMTI